MPEKEEEKEVSGELSLFDEIKLRLWR